MSSDTTAVHLQVAGAQTLSQQQWHMRQHQPHAAFIPLATAVVASVIKAVPAPAPGRHLCSMRIQAGSGVEVQIHALVG